MAAVALDTGGNQITFNFHATQGDDGSPLGLFPFAMPAACVCMTKGKIQSLFITGITANFSGVDRLDDGRRVSFNVSLTYNGLPGRSDAIRSV